MESIRYEGYGFNMLLSVILGAVLFGLVTLFAAVYDFTFLQMFLLIGSCLLLYCIIVPLASRPRKIITLLRTRTNVVQQPVIRTVETPIVRPVERIMEKVVYVNSPTRSKKLNIPHYEYVASTQTKKYHKRTCRLSKLIKRKYLESSNSLALFKHKHYKACKKCIKK